MWIERLASLAKARVATFDYRRLPSRVPDRRVPIDADGPLHATMALVTIHPMRQHWPMDDTLAFAIEALAHWRSDIQGLRQTVIKEIEDLRLDLCEDFESWYDELHMAQGRQGRLRRQPNPRTTSGTTPTPLRLPRRREPHKRLLARVRTRRVHYGRGGLALQTFRARPHPRPGVPSTERRIREGTDASSRSVETR